jgi:biotin transport system substrate-specific component
MSSSAYVPSRRLVLADLLPKSLAREVVLVAFGVLLTALAAQVIIPLPFTPVPITGQTFAILLLGAAYGPARGAWTLLAYLAVGAVGVPVYTEASGGYEVFLGATGGYLVAFPIAALVVGALARRGWDRKVLGTAVAFAVGSLVVYGIGVPWLAIVTGMSLPAAVAAGAIPFLVGDAIKALLAAAALPIAWRLLGRGDGPADADRTDASADA